MKENGGRALGRIFGISKNVCLYWNHKYVKEIKPKNKAKERAKVIKTNELYSFMERNDRIYVMTLVIKDTR